MTDSGEALRRVIREEIKRSAPFTVARVAAVRADGTVNLEVGGEILPAVPCTSGYPVRAAGDAVLVARMGAGWSVLAKMGSAGEAAEDDAAVSWGTSAPSGSGWQAASTVWVREGEVYAQTAAPAPASAAPVKITPTDRAGYRDGGIDRGEYVAQGAHASYPHPWSGAWVYGTSIADACAGKTVARMSVRVERVGKAHGAWGNVPVRLRLHAHTSLPSRTPTFITGNVSPTVSLQLGEADDLVLPAAWAASLASGEARGVGVTAGVGSDYALFTDASGVITATFS